MSHFRLPLRIEQLERRELLASWLGADNGPFLVNDQNSPRAGGNISAEVIDGTLVIRGDAADNGLRIYQTAPGEFRLESVNDWSKINGQSTKRSDDLHWRALRFTGVTKQLQIEMGDGKDFIVLNGNALPLTTIFMGNGDDLVTIGGEAIPQDGVPLYGNVIEIGGPPKVAKFQSDLLVEMASGDDYFYPAAEVAGKATIRMGSGSDVVGEWPATGAESAFLKRTLTADGGECVDLGVDQIAGSPDANWRYDPAFMNRIHASVLEAFAAEAAARQLGRVTDGQTWTYVPSDSNSLAGTMRDRQLHVEIRFTGGFQHVIDVLEARGVELEAIALPSGYANAWIRESDLAAFSNLDGFEELLNIGPYGNDLIHQGNSFYVFGLTDPRQLENVGPEPLPAPVSTDPNPSTNLPTGGGWWLPDPALFRWENYLPVPTMFSAFVTSVPNGWGKRATALPRP